VGIDVHLKSWKVTILTETQPHKAFSQPPKLEVLAGYLKKHFPNGIYHSAYEAGFSGSWAHYRLMSLGINNIVINSADVPTTQKEQYHKNDPVDSRKIAKSLRSGLLTPIHVMGNDNLEDRSLVRIHSPLVKDMTRFKVRIKSFLFFFGINYPEYFENTRTHWSRDFMQWLKEIKLETWSGRVALDILIREAENYWQLFY
jgi:transposase